jgi:ribosome biogenesis GTPase
VRPASTLHDDSGLAEPTVGDWVAVRDELAVAVLPRRTAFVRTVAGRGSAAQVVAANIDVVFVVESLVGKARLRRVERSALTGSGLDRVAALLPPGCTAAMVGPSGVAAIDRGALDPARLTATRKLQAEAHRQELRFDARARPGVRAAALPRPPAPRPAQPPPSRPLTRGGHGRVRPGRGGR